jgi:predicted nuclease of predicted toxin-antitoxin system
MDDAEVLRWACREQRVLLTNDKDFGARVFEKGEAHCGVILLRLTDERPVVALKVLARVLERFSGGVESRFIVASERRIRPDEADEMTENRA